MPCYIGWSRWMDFWMNGHPIPTRRWLGMVWAGILGSELQGPFRVSEGVKVEFITDYFLLWYKKGWCLSQIFDN